jgi:hypothetical protein
MTSVELADRYEQQNKIVDLYLQGQNETQISKTLHMQRKDVLAHLGEWREIIRNDESVREMAKQHLYGMSVHYQRLIAKLYEVVEEADDALQSAASNNIAQLLSQKTGAVKQIADLEEKRIRLEREAGLLEDTAMADEILESERKQELLIEFLQNTSADCPHCKDKLRTFMTEFTGKVTPVA